MTVQRDGSIRYAHSLADCLATTWPAEVTA
jgi:hypothetical protein